MQNIVIFLYIMVRVGDLWLTKEHFIYETIMLLLWYFTVYVVVISTVDNIISTFMALSNEIKACRDCKCKKDNTN
jgi:hypothetical protein